MASAECAFGFRVACATLTVGIIAFLESSHLFFQQQRLVWAMIIVAIGMSMTSGQVRILEHNALANLSMHMWWGRVLAVMSANLFTEYIRIFWASLWNCSGYDYIICDLVHC
jgi:hypothetical protein